MERNYRKEYNNYHSSPLQKKRRAGRNTARRRVKRRLGDAAVAGKDVDHKDRNPNNNSPRNLRVQTKRINRARNR